MDWQIGHNDRATQWVRTCGKGQTLIHRHNHHNSILRAPESGSLGRIPSRDRHAECLELIAIRLLFTPFGLADFAGGECATHPQLNATISFSFFLSFFLERGGVCYFIEVGRKVVSLVL